MGLKKKEALVRFNRDNIIDAAKKLFETKGIDLTTMDDIARQADYSKSTIYVYFKSKDEILNYIIYHYMNLLKENLQRCIVKSVGFEQCYDSICIELMEFQKEYPLYFEKLLGEIKVPKESFEEDNIISDIYKAGEEINDVIMELLRAGINSGFVQKEIALIPTVLYLWSSISGTILFANQKKEYLQMRLEINIDEYLKYSFRMILKSIKNERRNR